MTTRKPWIENDALAIKQFEIGWAWQRFVGCFFAAHGLEVMLPKLQIRESVDDIPDFADEWDLSVAGQRIEVKSRHFEFTSDPETFPWDRPFVDTYGGYEVKKVKPIAYVFVSQNTGALLSTPANEQERDDFWETVVAPDRMRNIAQETFYVTPRARLSPITRLVARLKEIGG